VAPNALLFTKANCPLCEKAKAILRRLEEEQLLTWRPVDIESDDDLFRQYWDKIPVVALDDGRVWYGKISEFRLRRALETPEQGARDPR
jgi:glutaredoxin